MNLSAIVQRLYRIIDEYDLNPQGYYYYLSYLVKKSLQRYRFVEQPFDTIRVDPSKISSRQNKTIDKWTHIGEIRGGNWDTKSDPIETSMVYVSLIQRFENDVPWDETLVYRRAIERIRRGESSWNGCRSLEDVRKRTMKVDNLFHEIRSRGFRSQSEIHGTSLEDIVLSGQFNRSKTDIAVSIGRDGELLLTDGHHRLAIAHVLGLETIPVRVVVRHRRWENVRQAVRNAADRSELTEEEASHLDHPDVPSDHLTREAADDHA